MGTERGSPHLVEICQPEIDEILGTQKSRMPFSELSTSLIN